MVATKDLRIGATYMSKRHHSKLRRRLIGIDGQTTKFESWFVGDKDRFVTECSRRSFGAWALKEVDDENDSGDGAAFVDHAAGI